MIYTETPGSGSTTSTTNFVVWYLEVDWYMWMGDRNGNWEYLMRFGFYGAGDQ
jgi:hypothetical protein